MNTIIYTDRSRIETLDKCYRKRYWMIEYQGRGLERAGDLKLDARIGTWCHGGVEYGIELITKDIAGPSLADAAIDSAGRFIYECNAVLGDTVRSSQLEHDIIEGGQIVTALTYAWLRTVAPRLLSEGEVLAIEKELTTDFHIGTAAGDVCVRLMSRPDIIWRRHSDGMIFIRNLKTTRRADDKFREKWALDQQTLSEPLAIDNWLKDEYYHCERLDARAGEPCCGGVIIDGLVTGEMLWDKYKSVLYHNNPLIYCWRGGDIGISGHVEFYPKYEWSCTGPHKFANGRRCEGDRTHKLSGVTKVSVADHYPGGIVAWVDYLIANHPNVIAECIVELPPIIRSEYQIERWKRQVLGREVAIKRHAQQIDASEGHRREQLLDEHFPMATSNGNCLYPGKCQFFECCHGVAAVDPLDAGFKFRVPNHPTEGELK